MLSEGHANPEMLTLARRSRGLTQVELADQIGVTQGTVSKYEAGVMPVSELDLGKLSLALDYPPQLFLQIIRIEGPGISESFHRKRQSMSANALHRMYALAEIRRVEIQKLVKSWQGPDLGFPRYPVDEHDDNPEKIARTVRALWQIPNGPVFNVTKTIEQAGGIIFGYDFGTRQIDGFSLRSATTPPLFYLNQGIPPDRWRWTLAHELGHIVMHFDPSRTPKLMEEQSDRFAGEFLAPAHELKPQLLELGFQKLAGLKLYWKISMQALVMRAYWIGTITERQRRNMFVRLSKAGYRLREPAELDPPIEFPEMPHRLVHFHREQLGYSDADIQQALNIGTNDLRTFYPDPLDHLLGTR